jgi:SAM-dependent methyltransferase
MAKKGGSFEWRVPADLEENLSTTAREKSVSKVISQGGVRAGAILQGAVLPEVLQDIIKVSQKSFKTPKFKGVGIELGAGLGLLGIVSAESPEVEALISIEICRTFVTDAIPAAAKELLGGNSNKVIPTYGSFEDYEIEDGEIDFAVQIESLHHSYDLKKAAEELFRILKPGGFLYSLDRSHPDSVDDQTLKGLLDHQYPKSWLEHHGYPSEKPMSRRENGEHEIRDSEWKRTFESAGFVTETFKFIAPKLKLWNVKKRVACLVLRWTPLGKRIKIPVRSGVIRGYIFQNLGIRNSYFGSIAIGLQPRWKTVMVFRKPL